MVEDTRSSLRSEECVLEFTQKRYEKNENKRTSTKVILSYTIHKKVFIFANTNIKAIFY